MVAIGRVRAALTGFPGGPGLNTFYFWADQGGAAWSASLALAAAGRVHAFFDTNKALYMTTTSITVSPEVDIIEDTTGTLVTTFNVAPPAVVVGANLSQAAPFASAALVTLLTDATVHGRRLKGRAFLSPIGYDTVENGLLTEGARIGIGNTVTTMATVTAGQPVLVVWSRPVKVGTPRTPVRLGSSARVTSGLGSSKLAVLTSRRD